MTREQRIALAVAIITVLATLIMLATLDHAGSKVQIDCMDPAERENVRSLVLHGIDDGLHDQIKHLFETWTKDLSEQPKRAMVGTNNAVNAHARARKQALAWEPPPC
jgi:hypothetical protein